MKGLWVQVDRERRFVEVASRNLIDIEYDLIDLMMVYGFST